MKKTQRKDAVRNIRKRIVSYLSVCLVVMLGVGGLLTTRYMGAGLEKRAAEYYNDHNFKDFEMVSSLGISDANIEKIKTADKVTDAEGVIQTGGSVTFRGNKRNVTVISLTDKVSVPDLTEGRMPVGRDECIIGEDFASIEGLKTGDRISLTLTGLDFSDTEADGNGAASPFNAQKEIENKKPLHSKEFTITGLMHHPDYLRRKSVNTVTVPLSAFNEDFTHGLYTRAFVKIEEPENVSMFSEDYFTATEGTRKKVEELAEVLETDRAGEVKQQAYDHIDKEWAKAEKELEEAQAKIDSGEAELNSKLAEGRKKLNDATKKLDEEMKKYNKKLQDGEATIADYEKKLKDGKAELKKKKKEFNKKKKELDSLKKQFKEAKGKFKEELSKNEEVLSSLEYILKVYQQTGIEETAHYKEAENIVATWVLAHQDELIAMIDFSVDKEVIDLAKKYEKLTGKDLVKNLETLSELPTDLVVTSSENVLKGSHYSIELIKTLDNALKAITEIEKALDDIQKEIDKAEKEAEAGAKKLKDAEKTIADGEKLLKEKKAELAAGKKKIKEEEAKAEAKIKAGWDKYYREKRKYESKLEEAKALLAENREEAEQKLAEARAEVEKITCTWIVLDRKGNAGFVDMNSNIDAINKMGVIFGILFTIVTAIVCFSTLVIMIDEEKKLVGTAKAFGFHKGEVLGKYLTFGLSAAVIGSVLSAMAAYVVASFIQVRFAASGMYPIGVAKSIVLMKPTVIFSLIISSVTAAASVIACSDILRSPASLLMKGEVLRKPGKKKKKTASKGGTLYSRLILRNMIDDKARVMVTIAIIGFSCMLIGLGISMKFAYSGMMDKQMNVVNKFDIRMDINDEVSKDDVKKLDAVLQENGIDFLAAMSETMLYRWDGRIDGLQLISGDPARLGEFYGISDPETGEAIAIPDEGVLIQKRMHESYGMESGDRLTLLDSGLNMAETEIKGYFVNYVGRAVIMSPEAYRTVFGEEYNANCRYIKLNGTDAAALKEQLLAVTDDISFVENSEFKTRFEAVTALYNMLVIITTGIAILISFLILTNLANIYLTRKKTELTVMRINGFSVRQTKNYLARESIFTTAAGLVLGVALGAVLTPYAIAKVQQPDLEFVKSFNIMAWVAAVGLETVFSLIINTAVFRKVKDLNLRDIV